MLNEYSDNSPKKAIKMYIIFFVVTVTMIFIFMALFSLISVIFNVDKALAPLFSALSLCFATLIGSYFSGRAFGGKALLVGGINALLLYLFVTIVAVIINGGRFTLSSLFNFLIITLSSVVGAVFGANSANKRKIK